MRPKYVLSDDSSSSPRSSKQRIFKSFVRWHDHIRKTKPDIKGFIDTTFDTILECIIHLLQNKKNFKQSGYQSIEYHVINDLQEKFKSDEFIPNSQTEARLLGKLMKFDIKKVHKDEG